MDRNSPLHNVLQKENWESISKAPERMKTNKDDSLAPLEKGEEVDKIKHNEDLKTLHKNEEILQHNLQKMKEVIDTLERVMNNKFNRQAEVIDEIIEKMNKLVQNNNDFEIKLNKIDSQVMDMVGPQTSVKEFAPKKEEEPRMIHSSDSKCKNTSTMENEVDTNAVSIETIFNCSNKKFD